MKNPNRCGYYRQSLTDTLQSPRRRALLGAIPSILLAPTLLAQAPQAVIRVNKLNGFEIRVADVGRSREFYQGLFHMPVQARRGDKIFLRVGEGPQFMAVRPLLPGENPAITHLSYSVEDFEINRLLAALETMGITRIDAPDESLPGLNNAGKSWVRTHGDTPELFFADERGLIVQLTDPSYCGGSGPLGSVCAAPESAPDAIYQLHDINHFTVFGADGAGANRFYQQLFGLSIQSYQGPTSPVTGIGDGFQFVMYAGPPGPATTPANIHHGCFNMPGFDEHAILETLTDYGLRARGEDQQVAGPLMHYISRRMPERGGAEGGTPELYFTDPDGILMQLQDVSYCGGGGYFGEICLGEA